MHIASTQIGIPPLGYQVLLSQIEMKAAWFSHQITTFSPMNNSHPHHILKVPGIQSSNFWAHVGLLPWWMCFRRRVVFGENLIPFSGTTLSQSNHLITGAISETIFYQRLLISIVSGSRSPANTISGASFKQNMLELP